MARIAVIGAGKVGLPMACHLADLKHEVCVYDSNDRLMEMLKHHINPCPREEGIHFKFSVAGSMESAIRYSDWLFVVTPTPLIGSALSSIPVVDVISKADVINKEVRKEIKINVVSTLDPRDAEIVCRPRPNLRVTYNPPLIRLGQVKRDLMLANMLFLGTNDPDFKILDELADIWRNEFKHPREIRGDVTSIACAKLAINATLSMRGAWGNDIAQKARSLGANVGTVFEALSAEPRIGGSSYMLPGAPPGGPCLPRDTVVWNEIDNSLMSSAVGVSHEEARRRIVKEAIIWVGENARKGKEFHPADKHVQIAVMGMGYKPNALDITGGIGIDIARSIQQTLGFTPICYDPSVAELVKSEHPTWRFAETASEAVRITDAAVICLDYPECLDAINARMPSSYPTLKLDFAR